MRSLNMPYFIVAMLLFQAMACCGPHKLAAQEKDSQNSGQAGMDYYTGNYFRYGDYIYDPHIRTVLLHKEGFELSSPVIELGSDQKLLLSFDDFNTDYISYKYTVVHCDAFWRPSDLMQTEYMEGFWEDFIHDHAFSLNTLQPYVHYKLLFPTENLRITRSGNYLLKVFREGENEQPVFTCRFFVVEPLVEVDGRVRWATDLSDRYSKQEVVFTLNKKGYSMPDPYRDLKVVIGQNGRWDNAITNIKPLIIRDEVLDYNLDAGNTFDGGNEFRRFDIRSVRSTSERVRAVRTGQEGFEAYLLDDFKRPFKVYASDPDINGRRLIKTSDYPDQDIESEYVHVHFFLPCENPLANGSLYVFGALTWWQFSDRARMQYNADRKGYEAELYLKQGYYNYEYLFLPDGKNVGETGLIEGNHFETENEYNIYIYYRDRGTLYDRLIAIKTLVSGK